MYNIIHIISAIIRYFLPNPYINWFNERNVADGFNIVVGGIILWKLSYLMTKCVYSKSIDDPAVGSTWYLINYCYLTLVITLVGKLVVKLKTAIIIFLLIYIVSCIIELIISNRKRKYLKNCR